MPLVWNIGSIFGPTIGGALANPFDVKPGEHIENPSLLQRFPYALPNIVAACFFTVGITVGFLYLNETLETLQGRPDYGRMLGNRLSALVKSHVLNPQQIGGLRKAGPKKSNDERQPLLKPIEDEESLPLEPKEPPPPPPSYKEVLNKQATLNLVVYTLLAMHSMAFDQLLPVYMGFSPLESKTKSSAGHILTSGNPLKFAGGFGLGHFRIGIITTCYGICGMLIQFFLFPPAARYFGVLTCLKACVIGFPISYFIMPFTALLPTTSSRIGWAFAVMLIKCFCSIFAFPCSTILLTNSVSSLRVLGTLNGFATSFSAIGRAAGPALGGAMFTIGVERGYVIAPWWIFTAVGVIAAVPVFFLVEGEGFGGEDDHVSDEEEIEEDEEERLEMLRVEALEGEAEAAGKPGPFLERVPTREEREEEEYGAMGRLTRTTTMSSALTLGSDEYDSPHASRQNSFAAGGPSRQASVSQLERAPTLSRRNSRRIMRRTSIPFGMGNQPISRRYSSNLGQSLGSSYHG